MRDINWLLSAVAQSTAALVAIVGGLVVSRLISLAGERAGLERQLASLAHTRSQTQQQADELRAEMVADYADDSIEDWTRALLAALPQTVTKEDLYEAMDDDGGWLLSDFEPHLDALRDTFQAAVTRIEDDYKRGGLGGLTNAELPRDADELENVGVEVPQWEAHRRIWTLVAGYFRDLELAARRRKAEELENRIGIRIFSQMEGFGAKNWPMFALPEIGMPIAAPPRIGREIRSEKYVRLLGEVSALDHELSVLRAALGDVRNPTRLWAGFWVLAAFAVSGIGYPMALMVSGPTMWAHWMAVSVVAVFGVGLAALLTYIAIFLGDLNRDPPSD